MRVTRKINFIQYGKDKEIALSLNGSQMGYPKDLSFPEIERGLKNYFYDFGNLTRIDTIERDYIEVTFNIKST